VKLNQRGYDTDKADINRLKKAQGYNHAKNHFNLIVDYGLHVRLACSSSYKKSKKA
jgi:hypothetical protein